MPNSYEDQILDAVEAIVDSKIASANYDKTISCTIKACADPTIGSYYVQYQDAKFLAYATNSETSYSNGTDVWVLVPGNDFDREKTILGAVSKIGLNYVDAIDEKDRFIKNGENILETYLPAELASYRAGKYEMVLYDVNRNKSENAITINENAMNLYLKDKDSTHLIFGCEAMTKLDQQQQVTDKGNYGLIFILDYLDNTLNKEVSRTFVFDTHSFAGNPYKQLKYTAQSAIYEHDPENFRRIRSIIAFTEGFPFSKPEEELFTDIWLKNIEICAAYQIDQEDLNNYSLTFLTKRGKFFDEKNIARDFLPIVAQVRIKGRVVNTTLQDLEFYWGYERADINYEHPLMNSYLKSYWYCLNDYNIIKGTEKNPEVVSWVPHDDTLNIYYEDVKARQQLYKCVAVFTDPATGTKTALSREITIFNLTSNLEIKIESDLGTQFYFDMGRPTLTCWVDEQLRDDLTFVWAKIEGDYDRAFDLPETKVENDRYNDIHKKYLTLYEQIEKGKELEKNYYEHLYAVYQIEQEYFDYMVSNIYNNDRLTEEEKERQVQAISDYYSEEMKKLDNATNETILQYWKEKLDEFDITERIEKYWAHKRDMSTITSLVNYKCSVFDGKIYLGTAHIGLINSLQTEGAYRIVMHNRTILYKYDANGISPTIRVGNNNKEPIVIKALNFTIYDNLGNPIDDEVAKHCHIEWEVPNVNTMLTHNYDDPIAEDTNFGTQTFQNLMSFNYGIRDYYDPYKLNNTIILKVNYKGESLVATTDFHFCKDGDPGTNGTEYTLLLVPNVVLRNSTEEDKKYGVYSSQIPIITQNGNNISGWTVNYKDQMLPSEWSNRKLLKAMFFHNEQCIFMGTQSGTSDEGIACDLEWSMLNNYYIRNKSSLVKDPSYYTINKDTGEISFTGYADTPAISQGHYANIVSLKFTYRIPKFPRDTKGNQYLVNYQTMPLYTVKNYKPDQYRINNVTGGFYYVTYSEDCNNPQYSDTEPFGIHVEYKADTDWNDITTNQSSEYGLNYDTWNFLGTLYNYGLKTNDIALSKQGYWEEDINLYLDSIKNNSENYKATRKRQINERYVKPNDRNECQGISNAIEVFVKKDSETVSKIHMPVHLRINRYGHQWINDWDGNSVTIDEEGGFILAPKIGAGKKESDNSFTGIVMGHMREGDGFDKVGLFGYYSGCRTIFLDSESGKAEFGEYGKGQIVLDPQFDKAIIRSGDYKLGNLQGDTSTNGGKGMMIDLTTPYIQYGNRNFSVDPNGHIIARDGGTIGGWKIDDYCIWQNSVGMSAYNGPRDYGVYKTYTKKIYSGDDSNNPSATYELTYYEPGKLKGKEVTNYKAFWAGNRSVEATCDNRGDKNSSGVGNFNPPTPIYTYGMLDKGAYDPYTNEPRFWVDFAGRFRAYSGKIGDGDDKEAVITIGHSGGEGGPNSNSNISAIYSRKHDTVNSKLPGFYLGDDGISIGKNFKVDAEGNLTCSGDIIFGGKLDGEITTFDFTNEIQALFSAFPHRPANEGETYPVTNDNNKIILNVLKSLPVLDGSLKGGTASNLPNQATYREWPGLPKGKYPVGLLQFPIYSGITIKWKTAKITLSADFSLSTDVADCGGEDASSHDHSVKGSINIKCNYEGSGSGGSSFVICAGIEELKFYSQMGYCLGFTSDMPDYRYANWLGEYT